MASVLISIDLEIKPYLKKYLVAKSENKHEPVKFARKSDYNIMLISLVSNYNSLNCIPLSDRHHAIEYFKPSRQEIKNDSILIILPFNNKKDIRSYNYLSEKSRIKFRNEVRLDFNFEFSRFLYKGLKDGKQRTDIVNEFKNLFNITEDDLKTESLYRHSSRLLQEIE